MNGVKIRIRRAVVAEIPVLRELIEASVRGLQTQDYTPAQMEGALETVFGVDSQLIEDGTYFVAEARVAEGQSKTEKNSGAKNAEAVWKIAGCGGWSKRKTLYGSDHWMGREDALLDPKRDAAKIRAFFVHPEWARRGIGSRILELCEEAARAEGFTCFEMGATLTGVPLYRRWGYAELERIELPLANGASLPIVRMTKAV